MVYACDPEESRGKKEVSRGIQDGGETHFRGSRNRDLVASYAQIWGTNFQTCAKRNAYRVYHQIIMAVF